MKARLWVPIFGLLAIVAPAVWITLASATTSPVPTVAPLFQGPAQGTSSAGSIVNTSSFSPAGTQAEAQILGFDAIPSTQIGPAQLPSGSSPLVPQPGLAELLSDNGPATGNLPEPAGVALSASFAGLNDQANAFGFAFIPPDPTLAAGQDHLLGAVNSAFGIFSKSGTLQKRIDATVWFQNVLPGKIGHCANTPLGCVFDPKVVYDHFADRWVVTYLATNRSTESWILVSVSDDANPHGAWCNWALKGNANGGTQVPNWSDYQGLGFDSRAVYVVPNQFTFGGGFAYSKIRILPKTTLYNQSCPSVTWTDLWDIRYPTPPTGADAFAVPTIRPAVTFGTPNAQHFVANSIFVPPNNNFVALYELNDPLTTPSLTATAVPVAATSPPPDAGQQGGGTPLIDVGGSRLRNAVYRAGSLWTSHNVADSSGNFAVARYLRIDTATATVTEDASVGASGCWYYYPAIAADVRSNMAMVFSRSCSNEFAGVRYVTRLDGGVLQPSSLIKAGEANYVKDLGSGRNRWGDYSGIAVDPSDSRRVWMFGEYAASPANTWGTWLGQVTFNIPPVAEDGQVITTGGTPVDVTLSASDEDTGDNLSFIITSLPGSGDLHEGTADISSTPYALSGDTVTYAPVGRFTGVDTFGFAATDGVEQSNPATFTVNVLALGFTVNSTGDGPDADTGDGACDDGGGRCTLRAAIEQANAIVGPDSISFNIPGSGAHTIRPASALPVITDPAVIDGYTQTGASPNTNPITTGSNAVLMVELDGSLAGTGSNGVHVTAGSSTVRGLVINRFDGNGVLLEVNGANFIEGNFIGVDINGSGDLGNALIGVRAENSPANSIGGAAPGSRNVISGNDDSGVRIPGPGATGNRVQGNFIGTDRGGTRSIANTVFAVIIDNGAERNFVGTDGDGLSDPAERNVIAGSAVSIQGADHNVVAGNLIGTDVAGTQRLTNRGGVWIVSASQFNRIGTDGDGTADAAERNVISGNAANGVHIQGSGTERNLVAGNFIGTDITGTVALPNAIDGVLISDGASGNTIGGTNTGAGNLISGNNFAGVRLFGGATRDNLVQGNLIGTDLSGTLALGNTNGGVIIDGNTGNMIGGTADGAGNTIAFNGGDGVRIGSGTGQPILGNRIFGNAQLGIDLGTNGVNPNDTGDADSGPNELQNYPVLTSATSASRTRIDGTLNSMPGASYRVELFSNPACDPSGNGEGETFIGYTTGATDGSGDAVFSASFAVTVPQGRYVTATATDPLGNTSEFSPCLQVTAENTTPVAQDQTVVIIGDSPADIVLFGSVADSGDSLTFVIRSLPGSGDLSDGASTIASVSHTLSGDTVTYVPGPNFGDADSFTFGVTDGVANSNVATVTLVQGLHTVSGSVGFQGIPSPISGARITFSGDGHNVDVFSSPATGRFEVQVPGGTYEVVVGKDGFLAAKRVDVQVVGDEVLPHVLLLWGNAFDDGAINSRDLSQSALNLGKTESPW